MGRPGSLPGLLRLVSAMADLTSLDRDSLIHLAEAFGNPLMLLASLMRMRLA